MAPAKANTLAESTWHGYPPQDRRHPVEDPGEVGLETEELLANTKADQGFRW